MKNKYQKGAITAIFLAVVALVLTLILATTQSQLLLSLRRSQSAADILIATYNAESEVNDIMARLVGGYLQSADIPKFTKNINDIKLEIEGEDLGDTQIVTVTAIRGFAVGKVQATRRVISTEQINEVEIALMLDCTSSMDQSSGVSGQSRFDALESAAVSFVDSVSNLPDADKYKLGVGIFGVNSAWLQYSGADITPGSGLSFSQIASAISTGFNSTRAQSPQCLRVANGTNVGISYRHAHDYLKSSKAPDKKQIEIVITDGEPNARSLDSECLPSTACGPSTQCEPAAKNYLRCTVADNTTFVPEIGQNGVRDPEIDAYAVTIFSSPPSDVVSIFQNYATPDGYFNASRASQLTSILDGILQKIIEDRSSITIKRLIPVPQ